MIMMQQKWMRILAILLQIYTLSGVFFTMYISGMDDDNGCLYILKEATPFI